MFGASLAIAFFLGVNLVSFIYFLVKPTGNPQLYSAKRHLKQMIVAQHVGKGGKSSLFIGEFWQITLNVFTRFGANFKLLKFFVTFWRFVKNTGCHTFFMKKCSHLAPISTPQLLILHKSFILKNPGATHRNCAPNPVDFVEGEEGAIERHERMATVAVQFTPTHDVLTATSLHRRTKLSLCRACLELRRLDHHRDRCRSCSSKSCEQILGLFLSSRGSRGTESRGLQQCGTTVALLSRSFEELFGRERRERRSWCASASAKAVHPASELQSAEELRAQLEALQHEAEQVRSKANSARLRFMRLTRVVEQLRQHAAMDVRMGKEDSARALLLEKQKVMKALEAARQRAELLEQLASKLNVAISMKETLLIAALSSAPLSVGGADADTAVHHVSPKPERLNEESTQNPKPERLNEESIQSEGEKADVAGVNPGQT